MADTTSLASSLEFDNGSQGDDDSAFGDNDNASVRTQSVTSSVYTYKFEDGRRYHAYEDGRYMLPNDETEQDRLDLQHHLFRLTAEGALYLAPIGKDVQNVVDIGCGTGIWAMQFADEHPSATVLGVDLSPIQPTSVPPNCSFRVDNVEADWIPEERFDFIHSRAMIGGFQDWPKYFAQAFEHLNPGGYIELQDLCFPMRCTDPTHNSTSKSVQWAGLCMEAAGKCNLNLTAPLEWAEQLRSAGFTDIHMKWFNWPIGPWAKGKKNKTMGRYTIANLYDGVAAPNALLTRVLGWSIDEVNILVAEVRNEHKEQKIHLYQPVCFCYAKKPEEPSSGEAPAAMTGAHADASSS